MLSHESSGLSSLNIEYTDINLTLTSSDRKGKVSRCILNDLSGSLEAGKLTAIIGPSGCGKSTLLNVLSGRMGKTSIPNSSLTGAVSMNDTVVDPTEYKQRFAYVMAEDALYATTTPREAFNFVCKLRLPHLSAPERIERADAMLSSLGLQKCADTYIGNALVKGVSSGERKRTAVGIELLPDPNVIFLDEPTTGLDSFSALELVRVVSKIAKTGKCVLCVIHQPSSEMFELFDDVVFMSQGFVVYHGPVNGVVSYFAKLGFVCPSEYNPADYIMYVLQTIDGEKLSAFASAWRLFSNVIREGILTRRSGAELRLKPLHRVAVSTQLSVLFEREFLRTIRDPSAMYIRFAITLFLGLTVGCIFYQVGETTGPGGIISSSHRGGLTNSGIFAMFSAGQSLLITFPAERPVLLREYSNGYYSIVSYTLSKVWVEFPLILIQILILTILIYFLEGFVGNFGLIFLGMFLIGTATAGTALMFGSALKEVEKVAELGFLLFVPQIMFAGFFVSIDQIPAVLQWAQYLCTLKYGMNILYIGEFSDLLGHENVFDTSGVNEDLLWMYIVVLCGITVATICSAMALLKYRAKSVY